MAQWGTDASDCFKRGDDGALQGITCTETITEHTNQEGGFWIVNNNINYEPGDGLHYYCNPGDCGSEIGFACGCDAGDGAAARQFIDMGQDLDDK